MLKPNSLWRCLGVAAAMLSSTTLAMAAKATPSLVVDVQSGEVLRSDDAGHAWYPASTTKLMTAYLALEALRAGSLRLDDDVVFSKKALAQESVESGLKPGSVLSVEDTLYAMLGVSANDAAIAIAEKVAGDEKTFVARMNATALRLGMTGTHFVNPVGLFQKTHVSTARDLAVLALAIIREFPDDLRFFDVSAVTIDGKRLESNNLLLTGFAGAIGMKTGFVCASGRNIVGLAYRGGRRVLVVVLGATTPREQSERAAGLLDDALGSGGQATGLKLTDTRNDPKSRPEDMRVRLCSPKSAAYEREQDEIYPMGLPGHASNLTANVAPKIQEIRTRRVEPQTSALPPR